MRIEIREIKTNNIIEALERVELDAEEFGENAVTFNHYYFKDGILATVDDFLTEAEALEFFESMLNLLDSHRDELILATETSITR